MNISEPQDDEPLEVTIARQKLINRVIGFERTHGIPDELIRKAEELHQGMRMLGHESWSIGPVTDRTTFEKLAYAAKNLVRLCRQLDASGVSDEEHEAAMKQIEQLTENV